MHWGIHGSERDFIEDLVFLGIGNLQELGICWREGNADGEETKWRNAWICLKKMGNSVV